MSTLWQWVVVVLIGFGLAGLVSTVVIIREEWRNR